MKKSLFYENQCYPDCITEKLWGPLEAGTVPVYYGAPNVEDHVPPQSLIHVTDFTDTEALYRYLEHVANNKTLYDSYHVWRDLPQPEFQAKMNLTWTHSTCRTCRWAYARLYGLRWNHGQPRIEDMHIPQKTCLDSKTGLLQHPIMETWTDATSLTAIETERTTATTATEDSSPRTFAVIVLVAEVVVVLANRDPINTNTESTVILQSNLDFLLCSTPIIIVLFVWCNRRDDGGCAQQRICGDRRRTSVIKYEEDDDDDDRWSRRANDYAAGK